MSTILNNVGLIGRLSQDPEIKTTTNGKSVLNFTLCVDKQNGKDHPEASFIDCVAWNQTADFISKFFKKGSRLGIVGKIETRTYVDNDQKKRKVTEVVVDNASFIEKKAEPTKEDVVEDEPAY